MLSSNMRNKVGKRGYLFSWLLKFQMEKEMTSLEKKLALLKTLRSGDLDGTEKLLASLATSARTNPELYQKFHSFVAQHKDQLKEMDNQEREPEPEIINGEEGDSEDWETDGDFSFSSQEQVEEEKQQPRLLKNIVNSKSAILIKPVKEPKKAFFVHPKPKNLSKYSSTLNLRDYDTKPAEQLNLAATLSKSSLLPKIPSKTASKPYFPPINLSKAPLKLKQ